MNVRRTFIAALLFTLVPACSFKTLYNQLDYLIPEYVEGMVTLDDVLATEVEQRTEGLIRWHRNSELKQYADWLQELQQDANPQLTESRLAQHIARLDSFWLALSEKINKEMAELLPLLDPEQQHELITSLAGKNYNFRKNYIDISEDERRKNYIDRMVDNYEKWLGDLTDTQLIAIRQASSELISSAHLRLKRHIRWQNGIRTILRSQQNRKKKTALLRKHFDSFDTLEPDGMSEISDNNKHVLTRLTVQIVHTMTVEQKQHFIDETGDYIRMFNELSDSR